MIGAATWRKASARADRVLVAAMAVIVALAGSIFGAAAAHSPAAAQTARLIDTVVEYVRVPSLAEPIAGTDVGRAAVALLLAQHRCLTEAMYYEARGEGEAGEKAVAEVIFHRLQSSKYGRSICAVVYEGAPKPGCQFSFACDGARARPKSPQDWRKAEILAARILAGEQSLADATDDAMNYHAVYVHPVWAGKLIRTAQIGNHIFYRTPDARPQTERAAYRATR